MQTIKIKTNPHTSIICDYSQSDKNIPGVGEVCHQYRVIDDMGAHVLSTIRFQKGPVKEVGINGCQDEDLIAIVIERLRGFQAGVYRCRENEIAIASLQDAIDALNTRTADRISRDVEGKALQ